MHNHLQTTYPPSWFPRVQAPQGNCHPRTRLCMDLKMPPEFNPSSHVKSPPNLDTTKPHNETLRKLPRKDKVRYEIHVEIKPLTVKSTVNLDKTEPHLKPSTQSQLCFSNFRCNPSSTRQVPSQL